MNVVSKRFALQMLMLQARAFGLFDRRFLARDVSTPAHVGHAHWQAYLLDLINASDLRVLEVGSREVTGGSFFRGKVKHYVGMDFYPGPNVDVTGDAHHLSALFPDQQFDLVISSSCFEHFHAPWQVAAEIHKVLAENGLVFVESHFAFSSHERPAHFFHFSDLGLCSMFAQVGFECLDSGMSSPIVGRFSNLAAPRLRGRPVPGLYAHAAYLGRKAPGSEQVYAAGDYPAPRTAP